MKLNKVQIQNFRSIVDSGVVEIEDGVTVVIGKNEQGKTTFLRGIQSFNSERQFMPNDLPNHLRPALEDGPASEIPIVTIEFLIEPMDRKKLTIVDGIDSTAVLKCTKYYDNHYQFWLLKSDGSEAPLKLAGPDISQQTGNARAVLDMLKAKLQAHILRLPTFAANQDKIDNIISELLTADFRELTQVDNMIKTFIHSDISNAA